MPTDNFQWTDELVYEYVCYLRNGNPKGLKSTELLKQFKQSKQQSNKDWEIIDCISYAGGDPHKYNEEICFSGTKPCTIHSVRRLSDNEVFTVGDEVKSYQDKIRFYISDIKITDGNLSLEDKNTEKYCFIQNAIKVNPKQPLFKTEDGIDIYHGDKFYTVTDDFEIVWSDAVNGMHLSTGIIARSYSTETQAKQYILYNKPCLSLEDVRLEIKKICDGTHSLSMRDWNFDGSNGEPQVLFNHFKQLVEQKINNK